MRHRRKTSKLQRKTAHRKSLLFNQLCDLIEHGRIRTTLAKTKALKPLADRLITLGKRGDLHARRQAISLLKRPAIAGKLFEEIAPAHDGRQGGYTRITKLGQRMSDSAPMAYIEWMDFAVASEEDAVAAAVAEDAS